MAFPESILINEVSPRDGLQSQPNMVDLAQKKRWLSLLAQSGLKAIELTSFVSPSVVPQLSDAETLMSEVPRNGVKWSALVPNLRGYERSQSVACESIAVFTAASEAFCQANTRCSIKQSLSRFKPVIAAAKSNQVFVRGYISCAWGCPFDDYIGYDRICLLANELMMLGCDQICLADTTGTAIPENVEQLISSCIEEYGVERIACHFHDNFNLAIINAYVALSNGIKHLDCAVAGLGGCPAIPYAGGNLSTEDLVSLCDKIGIETGVNLAKLSEAGQFICNALNISNRSKTGVSMIHQAKSPI